MLFVGFGGTAEWERGYSEWTAAICVDRLPGSVIIAVGGLIDNPVFPAWAIYGN
jgi:hypothetical protein